MTVDAIWLHHYDTESKTSSMKWKIPGFPPPLKLRAQKSALKMLAFWGGGKVGVSYQKCHFKSLDAS